MTMDCRHCDALLLDLAGSELSAQTAAEVRTHAMQCAECGAALARVERGLSLARQLPIEEPPGTLSERVMQAARGQAHVRPQGHVATPPWHAFMEWMRRVPMARQVQMAIVMLLIVGVGLWSVPELTRKLRAPSVTMRSMDHGGEAGPSAELQPAKPLDLAVDPYTRRIRTKGNEQADGAQARKEVRPAAQAAALPTGDEPVAPAEANPPAPAAMPANSRTTAEREALALAEPSFDVEEEATTGAAESARFAPPPPTAARKAEVAIGDAPAARYRALDDVGGGLGATAHLPPSKRQAAGAASATTTASTPAALLSQARSERAAGHCDVAVLSYGVIVMRFPNSAEAGPALAEGVGCYDRLGQTDRADALLRHAHLQPALTKRAQAVVAARAAARPASAASAADE